MARRRAVASDTTITLNLGHLIILLFAIYSAIVMIALLSVVTIPGVVALLVLAWLKPSVVTRMSNWPILAVGPPWARKTPRRFAAFLAAVVIPVSLACVYVLIIVLL